MIIGSVAKVQNIKYDLILTGSLFKSRFKTADTRSKWSSSYLQTEQGALMCPLPVAMVGGGCLHVISLLG